LAASDARSSLSYAAQADLAFSPAIARRTSLLALLRWCVLHVQRRPHLAVREVLVVDHRPSSPLGIDARVVNFALQTQTLLEWWAKIVHWAVVADR
jgi:hypothetical protein